MAVRILQKIFKFKLSIVMDKHAEGIVRNGCFVPCDPSSHAIVDIKRNLVVEKGKYKITYRNKKETQLNQNEAVGMLVIDNSKDSYDKFWGDEDIIRNYLCESRLAFYQELYAACKQYLRGLIVDIGCGSGDFLKVISEYDQQRRLFGFDFSETAVERCRSIIPDGEFIKGDVYATGYQDNQFDTVLCIEVLEHLENPESVLKELARICAEDGLIIISIPNGAFDSYIGHLNFWSENDFKTLLQNFTVQDFQYLEDNKTMLFILKNKNRT